MEYMKVGYQYLAEQARDVHYNLDQKATEQEILDNYCQQCSRKGLKLTT